MVTKKRTGKFRYTALAAVMVFTAILASGEDRYLKHARSQFDLKKYITASQSYEKAYKYAKGEFTAKDFFQYGTSLKEAKKFAEAIPYFERAIMMGHEKSPAIQLDIAGMHSQAKNERMAQKYVRLAVNHDPSLLKDLVSGKDLDFVRSQPGWGKFHESLKSVSQQNFSREDMFSILSFKGKKEGNELKLWLCSNGRVVQTRKLDSCNKGFVTGKWELNSGRVNIVYDGECVYEGVGNKTASSGGKGSYTCDGFDHQFYVPKCGRSSEVLNLAAHTIADARGGKKPDKELFNTKFFVEFVPMAKDPIQCDPNFKASKFEDMKVE